MTEGWEVRFPPRRRDRLRAILGRGAILVGILVALGSAVLVATTESFGRRNIAGAGLFVIALLLLAWGARNSGSAKRSPWTLWMRMDDKGVWMRMGDMKTRKVPGAFAPWNAIESVELTLMPFGPEVLGAGREGVRNVMRWVLSDEDAVEHDPFAPIDLKGASEYGLSPVQAALCTSFPPQHVELIDPILAWIHKNVPDLTVKDKRT